MGNGETPIFPVQIFKCKEGVNLNEGAPNYDLFQYACAVSGKRLFPNFSFLDAPFNKQYYIEGKPETEVAYMGCRSRVIGNINGEEQSYGRGNLSFTTINLPAIAIRAKNGTDFWEELSYMMDLVHKQLIHRAEIVGKKTKKNFPFLMGSGVWVGSENLSDDEPILDIIKHGSLGIGFIGLAETVTH
jgi:ribonucleoside-triphosphate reductase